MPRFEVTYTLDIKQDEKIDGVFYSYIGSTIDRVWKRTPVLGNWMPTLPVQFGIYQTRFTPWTDIPSDLVDRVVVFYDAKRVS